MSETEPLIEKKIKFRSISTTADPNYIYNKVDDMYLPRPRSKSEQKFKAPVDDSDQEGEFGLCVYIFEVYISPSCIYNALVYLSHQNNYYIYRTIHYTL